MKKILSVCLIALLLALIAGCIDYQETITLNSDGSGTINIRYAISKAYLDQAAQPGEGEDSGSYDEMDEMPSEDEIREQLEMTESSVELVSFEESETEEWRIWAMEFSFEKLSDFDEIGNALSDEENYDPDDEPQRSYVKQPDGTWLFTHSLGGAGGAGGFEFDEGYEDSDMPSDSEYAEATGEASDESEDKVDDDEMPEADSLMAAFAESMKMMFSGAAEAKLKLTVHFPGKILESNATSVEGNTAVWEASLMSMPSEMTAQVKL
jgi:hypothetical protein